MKFRKIKIADLIPASYNPRKKLKPGDKEYEKIKNSITEFGYVEPVIVNFDLTIIGGHQRVTVLSDLGYTEIDCIVIDIDKNKEKALNIALNKITGEWNKELLADLIKDLQDSDFDVAFTGFEPPEIEQLFNAVHDKKITEDDFDVDAELQKPAVAKHGDVWLLGRHRVVCGDSTLPETYEILMAGQKANLVVTDPPYNVNYEGSARNIQNDHMEDEKFYQFLFAAFVNMEQSMEQDASIYVFHADTEGLNFRKAFLAAGFYLSGCCIWRKQSLVLGRSPYQWQHEPVLFGWKKGGKHNWYSDRKQTTIWEFDRPKQSKDHPTMKPVGLVAYPIEEVRKLYSQGQTAEAISRLTGHTWKTVTNYLKEDCSLNNGHYDQRMPGKLAPYEKTVIDMRSKGITYSKIHEYITEKGYIGTVASLRVFMQKERTHQRSVGKQSAEPVEYIPRKFMSQLIYRKIEDIKGFTQEQYESALKKYPVLAELYTVLKEFHRIVFSQKGGELDNWIETAAKLQIEEIDSYLGGLKKDLSAVKNGSNYEYNNGLTEGSVNKIKLTKRIMYGRNSFLLLKAKLLLNEYYYQID